MIIRNGKIVIKSLQKGLMKGTKKLKGLLDRILTKFKFKKFKLERKKDHILLYGEVNPWVLLANGRIKEVDSLEGKKAGISTQAEYDKIKDLKVSERKKVYNNAVAKEDGKIDFDSIKEPYQKFSKEQRATKPKNSRDPKKWQDAGGSISIDEHGVWTYINSEGVSVRYPGGYPDFTPHIVKVNICQKSE